jgi:hypothetical protein
MKRKSAPGRTAAAIRIGVSGWRYPPWRGVFLPKGLQQRRELEFASRGVPSIELNGSFYSLQRPENMQLVHETPSRFVFSVKAPRFITHIKRLRDIGAPLANFLPRESPTCAKSSDLSLAAAARCVTTGRCSRFPGIAAAGYCRRLAASPAPRRRVTGRARIAFGPARRLRHALEVRHDSFIDPALVDQLRRP